MNQYGISLERGRLRVVIATIVINIVVVSLLTFAPWSDRRTGVAHGVVDLVIVVDDASHDETVTIARTLSNVQVEVHPSNAATAPTKRPATGSRWPQAQTSSS